MEAAAASSIDGLVGSYDGSLPFSLRSPIATFSSITCVYLEVGGVVLLAFYILSLLAGRDMLRRSE